MRGRYQMEDQKKNNPDLTNTGGKHTDFFIQNKNSTVFSRPPDTLSHEAPLRKNKLEMQTKSELSESERHLQVCMDTENQQFKMLQQRNAELERSNGDLETFAYAICHDLQEPLRTVTNFSELLQTRYKGELDEAADKFIQQIVGNTDRMSSMIHDLLEYSRLQTQGKIFEPVDLKKVVQDALANLGIVCKETQATVTWDSLPIVTGDASLLNSLLQNLIGNSIKFRKETEPPIVHIGVDLSSEKKWHFFVRENGIGIDPKYFDKIFILFKRLHPRDKYPGTGIGLATCKKIVERHGGRIWVDSELGKGATIHFTLPKTEKNYITANEEIY